VEERSLKFVAEACGAEIRALVGATTVKNVCTDSRQAQPGDLFFAIRGEKHDGHDFLEEVAAKKAGAVVIERKKFRRDYRIAACCWWTMRGARSANWRRRIANNLIR